MELVEQLRGLDEEWWNELEDPPGYRLEIIDGEIVMNPSPGQPHQDWLFNLESLFRAAALDAGLDVFTVQDHEWRFVVRGLVTQAPRPDLKMVPTGGEVPLVTVEILSPSDFGRLPGGLPRIEGKRRDYAARGALWHLEPELVDGALRARWFHNEGGTFELADEATGDEELVVAEPLPFRLVPAKLAQWYNDFVAARTEQAAALASRDAEIAERDAVLAEREAVLAAREAEIIRLRRQLGERVDEEPPPANS